MNSRPREELTQVWIPKDTKKQVRELKRQLKKSQLQILEEAIDLYIQANM